MRSALIDTEYHGPEAVCLGYNHDAEHEWGIGGIRSFFGMKSLPGIEKFREDPQSTLEILLLKPVEEDLKGKYEELPVLILVGMFHVPSMDALVQVLTRHGTKKEVSVWSRAGIERTVCG